MKNFILTVLMIALSNVLFAQTYCIGYDVVSSTGGNFVIDVKLQGSAAFDLGFSTIAFSYNGSSLSNPTLVTDYLAASTKYEPTTVIRSNPSGEGYASINVYLKIQNNGSTIAAAAAWTNICRITFANTGVGTSGLQFSAISDVYKSNNVTRLDPTGGCAGVNVPLPIELKSFEAQKVKQTTQLQWAATNTVNIAYFEVEKSADGVHFDTIGKVKALNIADLRTYKLTDGKPFSGINFYRLKIVEMDGKVTYSKIVSLIFEADFSAQVYPNPMHDDITLNITADNNHGAETIATLTDAMGRELLTRKIALSQYGTATTTILTNQLPNGAYILTIKNGETVWHQKMVKQ